MKKDAALYNVMFPLWFFFIWPNSLWLLILPVNFGIDSLVLYLAMRRRGVQNKSGVWKSSILKIWLFGFLSDMAGAALILGISLLLGELFPNWAIYTFPGVCVISALGVALAGLLIYLLNRRFSFSGSGIDGETAKRLSAALAVFTAPYVMIVPIH